MLARDRIGIKPLYYGTAAGRFMFASELKAILQLPEVDRRLNWSALAHLLAYGTTPPGESIVDGIHKLEPGHGYVLIRSTSRSSNGTGSCAFNRMNGGQRKTTIEELRAELARIDPATISSATSRWARFSAAGSIPARSSPPWPAIARRPASRLFPSDFVSEEFDELPYARLVAKRFGTDHHELVLEPDVVDLLDHLAWDFDEPFGDASAIPTYMVSRLAGQHVKVVLSGDGGDELFGGYDKYVVEGRDRMARFLPGSVRALLARTSDALPEDAKGKQYLEYLSKPDGERYLYATTLFRHDHQQRLLTDWARGTDRGGTARAIVPGPPASA